MSFKIDQVEKLPTTARAKAKLYDDIVEAIAKKPIGTYRITVENKKTATVYQQIYKLIKDRKDIKLHKIKNEIFIEKLFVKK